jgi:rSAM-partnered protein
MDEFDQTVDAPRSGTGREWEVFCREREEDPLTHVGSVSAPSASIAREQATQLFAHTAQALWLCPADETVRIQEGSLGVVDDEIESHSETMETTKMHDETLGGEPQ